jgi:uncharacterized protein YijF (DUF1287 family)
MFRYFPLLSLLLFCSCYANERIAQAAQKQIGVTVNYDPGYVALPYPGGDVPPETGVCSDVVVRALRQLGIDLQKEVHEDMKANFSAYPSRRLWGLKRPDKNIDHRRVPNLRTFFTRKGWRVPATRNPADYQPGDIVTCLLGDSITHIMIVSTRKAPDGTPLCIHNIGAGVEEENCLFDFTLTGHFRPKL